MTAEVRSEYDAWKKERLERETSAKAEQAQLQEKKGADDARERHLRELRSLFRPIVTNSNKVNIALVVTCDSKSADCDQVSQKLLSGLQAAAPKIVFLPDYFTRYFIEKGYFEKAYQGDTSIVKKIAGLSPIDYLLICKGKAVTAPSPAVQDLFTSRIDFGFLLLDREGKQANRGNFEVAGPGFSKELALDRGIGLLTERYASQLLSDINTEAP